MRHLLLRSMTLLCNSLYSCVYTSELDRADQSFIYQRFIWCVRVWVGLMSVKYCNDRQDASVE